MDMKIRNALLWCRIFSEVMVLLGVALAIMWFLLPKLDYLALLQESLKKISIKEYMDVGKIEIAYSRMLSGLYLETIAAFCGVLLCGSCSLWYLLMGKLSVSGKSRIVDISQKNTLTLHGLLCLAGSIVFLLVAIFFVLMITKGVIPDIKNLETWMLHKGIIFSHLQIRFLGNIKTIATSLVASCLVWVLINYLLYRFLAKKRGYSFSDFFIYGSLLLSLPKNESIAEKSESSL
ncbi:hypothetical protein H5T87_07390 [bacterium]|nr:hypothetical protein [bacterium]